MGLFHTIRESYINPLTSGKTRIPNAKDFKMAARKIIYSNPMKLTNNIKFLEHFVGGPMVD
jgi:hypothetical protein